MIGDIGVFRCVRSTGSPLLGAVRRSLYVIPELVSGRRLIRDRSEGDKTMLWTIIAVLVVLWLLGMLGGIGGSLIHALLVIALVVLVFQLLTGRRAIV